MAEEQQPKDNKRKRMPSQYASHIQDFKNNNTASQKKVKNTRFAQPPVLCEQNKKYSAKYSRCILPTGKEYSLQIIVNPQQAITKKIERKDETNVKIKPLEEKKQDANICLLNKLLSAFQNLQKEQEKDSKQNNQVSRQNKETKPLVKEERTRRQRQPEEKWNKCYERYKDLGFKLEALEKTYLFLI